MVGRTTFPVLVLVLGAGSASVAVPEGRQPVAVTWTQREAGWRSDLDLQHWSTSTFHSDFVASVQHLSAAHGPEQITVLLNTIELYLTHMLLFEASSALEGISPELPEHQRRHRALRDAADLLSGKKVADFATSPLADDARPDAAFWRTLQAVADADVVMLDRNIEPSFAGLALQSRAVLRAMLPVFIEAAIETGHADYADGALQLMEELPDLDTSPTGSFLRGRAQERRGNDSSALKAYFKAAEGWDQYAARARLAVADMSLREGSQGALLAAQSTLKEGEEAWRGNRYELEVLRRLAEVYQGTDNAVEALLTLGKLLARFPNTQQAVSAAEQAETLMQDIYGKGSAGSFPLATWMEVHLRLLPFYRYSKGFPHHTEVFADYLLSLGSTDLAVQEYRRAISLLEERSDAEQEGIAPDLFRLNLQLARAQHIGGLSQEGLATLERMPPPVQASQTEDYVALKAEILARLEESNAFLSTNVGAPTVEHLRKRGALLVAAGKWQDACEVLLHLWQKHPGDFNLQDGTRLLIAAKRTNDMKTMQKVTAAFPDLTSSKPLTTLAKSIHEESPQLLPLRADSAAARLQRLEDAFDTIKESGILP